MKKHPAARYLARILLLLISAFLLFQASSLQIRRVHARQDGTPTTEATLEATATLPTEEIQPAATNTAEAETATEPPASVEATAASQQTNTPPPTSESADTAAPAILHHVVPLPGEYAPDEVLVRFKNATSEKEILQCLSGSGAALISTIESLGIAVVQVPRGKVSESVAAISSCSGVRYAEPNYAVIMTNTLPADPHWGWQYGMVIIHAPQGWDYSTGSAAVTIAILDTGVDLGHLDFAGKFVPGYDFVNNDNNPQDDNGHGTLVAGIAAATGNNGVGVAGVSWGARIMPIKVLDSSGDGFLADVADGIQWAADSGAQVINISLASDSPSLTLQDAVNYAYGKGVTLVAAAGNDGGVIDYPAQYSNVIAVGAVDGAYNRAAFSNFGPELDLVAPGINIYSTTIGGYMSESGTSMSAPFVSGLAAILRGYPGGASPDAIASILKSTARDLGVSGVDDLYGYGIIQMDRAIQTFYPASNSNLAGNQTRNYFSVPAPTWTFSPSPSPSPSPTATNTETPTATYTPVTPPSQQATSEANVPPISQSRETASSLVLPSLGLGLISLGTGMFVAGRRRVNRRWTNGRGR